MFGEVGSILTEVKKASREAAAYPAYRQRLLEEFGDALWYLTRLIVALAPSLLDEPLLPLEDRSDDSPHDLSMALALGEKVGALLSRIATNDAIAIRRQLRRTWRAMGDASRAANIDLMEAANNNLRKIRRRWPETREYLPFFDVEYPEEEQIPRVLAIEFRQRIIGRRRVVVLRCNGVNVGNRLTDNIARPDAYRFHVVFHFAYAVFLGWSPVVRALLHCKRKSRPQVDENQDGARARVIEEGVSASVFSRSKHLALYKGVDQVDYDLLKTIQGFVRGFEVEAVPLWQWEEAILKGHSVFRRLRANDGGHVRIDLLRRELAYRGPPGMAL